ncbi:hypothetical protein CMV_004142 [Castanea mollissima]|uniref:Anaphase-promoting complex subunit 4 n=1 Tax=Castanea mollissima TaxID=60419 RepID=A0A8J4RUQ0_9ROSI|nr:hypothetical protein CMV_004142 [Castanea mollissima]
MVLSIMSVKHRPFPSLKCKRLTVKTSMKKWDFLGIASLLQSSPYVETLVMDIKSPDNSGSEFLGRRYFHTRKFNEVSHWKSKKIHFKSLLQYLKTVKICGCVERLFHRKEVFISVVQFLLKNAKVLEKMVISEALVTQNQHMSSLTVTVTVTESLFSSLLFSVRFSLYISISYSLFSSQKRRRLHWLRRSVFLPSFSRVAQFPFLLCLALIEQYLRSFLAMETDEDQRVIPFQLQFDKPVASQIKIAEWNPEKDLLAMVTEDSKILLHRFNWQRLWTISPGRCITSLCWRPDGKAIAVGLEDGTVSLHDVENGKLLRSLKSHTVAVVCLNWEEDGHLIRDDNGNISTYEDRTSRFFPPAPRVPRMPGVVSGDTGFMDDNEDSFRELSNSSHQRFNILCSGDKDGSICFSIFGIFPIGKINIHKFCFPTPLVGTQATYRLLNASIYKVALSKDLCHLIVMCSGELIEDNDASRDRRTAGHGMHGLHSLMLDTSIFWKRKNELHQVAQQASNIEDLTEVIRASLSVMCKQWSDAMHTFHEKFDPLSTLIIDHGLDSSPQEEFLSLLGGARTSPPVHQFLVNSLSEVGAKRVSKVVCGAGKELQLIVLNHLQPAAEIIGFRMGELRGLSRWRARYQGVGLDETLINNATEKAGMLLVQVERFMRVLSSVVQQFSNFFNWLLKCIKLLMSEPSDQLLPYNSELAVIFLKFLYDQDPVRKLLELSEADCDIEIEL